jgi:hypothetical protein
VLLADTVAPKFAKENLLNEVLSESVGKQIFFTYVDDADEAGAPSEVLAVVV